MSILRCLKLVRSDPGIFVPDVPASALEVDLCHVAWLPEVEHEPLLVVGLCELEA